MSDSVGQYLDQIGLVPLLNADEERELSQIIERGREAQERLDNGEKIRSLRTAVTKAANAKDRFIRSNLRLVVSIARRYPVPTGMELLDLVQEGNLGLEHAVDKFDWRKGFKFSTYATFWIRQAIGRALDQKASIIRLPGERAADLRARMREASNTGEELDEEHAKLQILISPTSLDRPVGDDGGTMLMDLVRDDDQPGPEEMALTMARMEMLEDLLEVLEDRARNAVRLRFGLEGGETHSYREIGEELGLTAEAARRLIGRSMDQLQDHALSLHSDAA